MMNKNIVVALLSLFFLAWSGSLIQASETEYRELFVGESMELDVKVVSGDEVSDLSSLTWTNDNSDVVSISGTRVRAKEAGQARIIGRKNDGNKILEVVFEILVKSTVKDVEILTPSFTLKVGENKTIQWEVLAVDELTIDHNQSVSITSTDQEILTVSSSGEVQGKSEGVAYIQVRSRENGKYDSLQVDVISTVDSIEFEEAKVDVFVGEEKGVLLSYIPLDGFDQVYLKEAEYTSDDRSIVRVDHDGSIRGISQGETYIRARSKDGGHTDRLKVEVHTMVAGITLSEKKINLTDTRPNAELEYTIIPIDGQEVAFQNEVRWSTTDSSICSVNSKGYLRARKSGTVLITATSIDGGKEAHCTVVVDVSPPSKPRDIQVTDIELGDMPRDVKVGQEIPIPYTLFPENANKYSLKFSLGQNEFGKVYRRNGQYYYMPLKAGAMILKVYDGSTEYDDHTFFADSMVDDFQIDTGVFEEENGRYIVYLGQTLTMEPDFDLAGRDYPLLDDVTYTVGDSRVLKVQGDKITGKAVGHSTLKGVSADGEYDHTINIRVISSFEEVFAEAEAEIGIDMAYQPAIQFELVEDPLYDLEDVLDKSFDLEVEDLAISTEFIDNEIAYEEAKIEELDTRVDQRDGDLSELLHELQAHRVRFLRYKRIRKEGNSTWCPLDSPDTILLDRENKALEVYKIRNDYLYGYISSKMTLKVKTNDPNVETKVEVTVLDNSDSIILYDEDGEVLTSSEDIVLNYFNPEDIFIHNPSSWAVEEILEANKKGLLVRSALDQYTEEITREEFVELLMNFYKVVMGFPDMASPAETFTDTDNIDVLQAASLGLVNGVGQGQFDPDGKLTREQFCVMLDWTLKVMEKEPYKRAVNKDFKDETKVSDWAIKSVYRMTREYGILEGDTNQFINPAGETSLEQAVALLYRTFIQIK